MHSRFIEKSITVLILCIVYSELKGALVNLKNGAQLLLTLNEHNCFISLIFLKHFSPPRKDCYIFLLDVYCVKIKNELGNVHFNYFWFQIFLMRTFYKLAVTMKDNGIRFHD